MSTKVDFEALRRSNAIVQTLFELDVLSEASVRFFHQGVRDNAESRVLRWWAKRQAVEAHGNVEKLFFILFFSISVLVRSDKSEIIFLESIEHAKPQNYEKVKHISFKKKWNEK